MEYTTKEVVQKCLDDLSRENLIGNENDTFISLAEAKDRIEELPTADVVPKSEVEDAKIKAVATVISEISKMLKSSYNRKHAFVNDEFLRGRDGAYQEFIDILNEISRKNAEGEK